MRIKRWSFIVLGICVFLFISVGLRMYFVDKHYYDDAVKLNQALDADGLKLMMTLEEVRSIYGEEDMMMQGFGGDFFEYPSRGVVIAVSTDRDYDLYYKVSDIRLKDKDYSVYKVKVGMGIDKAEELLSTAGFEVNTNAYGQKSFTNGCVFIDFSVGDEIISAIRIIVTDKNFDKERVY